MFLRFGPFRSFLDRFEAVFGRFKPFWIVWERFGHPGLPNQTSKSQIRQPYFREPLLEKKTLTYETNLDTRQKNRTIFLKYTYDKSFLHTDNERALFSRFSNNNFAQKKVFVRPKFFARPNFSYAQKFVLTSEIFLVAQEYGHRMCRVWHMDAEKRLSP